MTDSRMAQFALAMMKPSDVRQAIEFSFAIEVQGVGRIDVTLNEHQFAHLVSGTMQTAFADFTPEAET